MIISEINYDEKTSSFKLILENKDTLYADYNLYNDLSLTAGVDLKDEEIKIIKQFTSRQLYLGKVLNYISYRNRTEKEIRDRIAKETSDIQEIEEIICHLKKLELIDDIGFAKSYYENKRRLNNWSSNRINYELKLKGVKDFDFSEYFEDVSDYDFDNAKFLIDKNINIWSKKYDKYKLKNKVYNFLAQKGFSYDIVNLIFEEYSL